MKAVYAIAAALIAVGVFADSIARTVTTLVCGTVTMPGDFVAGIRLVIVVTTSIVSMPVGCAVPLLGIRITSARVFAAIAGLAAWRVVMR